MAVTSMSQSSLRSFAKFNKASASNTVSVEYLVVGGGGGGGGGAGGAGAGAGGLRAGSLLILLPFAVEVGAGGSPSASNNAARGFSGGFSQFGEVVAIGGGGGGGTNGGSGSASQYNRPTSIGLGISGQGENGGQGTNVGDNNGGGGGGAGFVGGNASSSSSGGGGDGLQSSITGSSIYYAGGGGGGTNSDNSGGAAGQGGGGLGRLSSRSATAGTVNTGGGGGGGGGANEALGQAGGSGLVIIKYPDWVTLSIGAGLTSSTATVTGYKITTFTAGSDEVGVS